MSSSISDSDLQKQIDDYQGQIDELEEAIAPLTKRLEELDSKHTTLLQEQQARNHVKKLAQIEYKRVDFGPFLIAYDLVLKKFQYREDVETLNSILAELLKIVTHPIFIKSPQNYMDTEWRKNYKRKHEDRYGDVYILPDDAVKEVLWEVVKRHTTNI